MAVGLAHNPWMAWAAGLFEGEGCMEIRDGRYPRMVLSMTDKDVVDKFCDVVGVGKVNGPYIHGDGLNVQPQWAWSLSTTDDCADLVRRFLPFFGERRSARALEVVATSERSDRRLARRLGDVCSRGHRLTTYNTRVNYTFGREYLRCLTCEKG